MNWRKWLIGTWNWKRPLKSLAFIYGCLVIVAVFFAERLIFIPPAPGYADDPQLVKFVSSTSDTIVAIERPAKPDMPTILYTHGNGEDLGTVVDLVNLWADQGFGVLAYDFPGYGRSTGKPLEQSCEAAIDAAWQHLTETRKIDPKSIVLISRSVGGGPTVWLAERKAPVGMILMSPFTSAFAVRIPVPILPCDRFPNLKRIPQVKCPLLIIHGEADTLIPPSHGRRLFEAATVSDKQFLGIPGAGHDDLMDVGGDTIDAAIRDFMKRTTAGR